MESLLIMSGCVVAIAYARRRTAMHRNMILSSLTATSPEDYLRDPRALWEAHFHPIVSSSLSAIAYRQYDYQVTMSYRSSLARWLHKHLATVYLNAGFVAGEQVTPGAPWQIRMSDDLRRQFVEEAPQGYVVMQEATKLLAASRQTVLQRVKRGELEAVHVCHGRRKGLRIRVIDDQPDLFTHTS